MNADDPNLTTENRDACPAARWKTEGQFKRGQNVYVTPQLYRDIGGRVIARVVARRDKGISANYIACPYPLQHRDMIHLIILWWRPHDGT